MVAAFPAEAQPLRGKAVVIDGDSLTIGRREVRLFGVDAFEYTQRCGRMACGKLAALYMEAMIGKQTVVCARKDMDGYGRIVALCRLSDGRDLGQEMVRAGYAVAYRQYSPKYVMDEAAAKKARAGAWAYGFQQPAAYRKPH